MSERNIYEKLSDIQNELKVPKGQYNSFSKFNFRSAEDIKEAVKPINKKHGAVLITTNTVKVVNERYYIKALAMLRDLESDDVITVEAVAREDDSKKGMDASQLSGSASSYATKYALNNLYAIDDTKDADTDEFNNQQQNQQFDQNNYSQVSGEITKNTADEIEKQAIKFGELKGLPDPKQMISQVNLLAGVSDISELTEEKAQQFLSQMNEEISKLASKRRNQRKEKASRPTQTSNQNEQTRLMKGNLSTQPNIPWGQ